MAVASTKSYKEAWIPGFKIESSSQQDTRLTGCSVGEYKVSNGMENTELVVYSGADHGYNLEPAEGEYLVIEDSFTFGLLHEHLEQLDLLLAVEYVPKECWL